jgi:hypothetical protein
MFMSDTVEKWKQPVTSWRTVGEQAPHEAESGKRDRMRWRGLCAEAFGDYSNSADFGSNTRPS